MMASQPSSNSKTNTNDLKPGSSAADAAKLSGEHDFGVSNHNRAEREYASQNTKRSDHGNAPPAASEELNGQRTAGVGGNDAGPGSSSAGDLDTDFAGVGGSSLAANITKGHQDGADDAVQFGTPDRAARAKQHVNPSEGHVAFTADDRTLAAAGADSAGVQSIEEDGSFTGEISMAEADGDDDAGR